MEEIVIGKHIISSYLGDKNNSVLVTIGDKTSGDVEAGYAQYVQHVGFCSVPPDADIQNQIAAEPILIKDIDNRDIVIGARHPASQVTYANMAPGDTIMFATDNSGSTKTRVKCNAAQKAIALQTVDSNGMDMQVALTQQGLFFTSPFGKLTFDETGFHITHKSGASFHLGSLGASVGGVGLNSHCSITSDLFNPVYKSGMLGSGPVYLPITLAPIAGPAPGVVTTAPVATPIINFAITSQGTVISIT